MKRYITFAAALFALSLGAAAQTWQDAWLYSDNNYVGTARSVAMGNALTAVGGDLGSITLNPAGSAVAGYSQFVLTPSLTITSTHATGTPYNGSVTGYQDDNTDAYTRFKMPNFGYVLSYDTHNQRGVTRYTIGFVGNATNDYTRKFVASGSNSDTSVAGGLASDAEGFSTNVMNGGWDQASMPSWKTMTAYKGGMFSPVTGADGSYVAATERVFDNGDRGVAGMLNQYYGQQRRGGKYDYLFNFGMEFSGRFFLGLNLGITSLNYKTDEYWKEEAVNPNDFQVTYNTGLKDSFDNLRMRYALRDKGAGIYAKAGFIWRPFSGLRIGAAIQTPTLFDIQETYGYDAKTVFTSQTLTAQSPEDLWDYEMTTPYRVNAGIAYTFGKFGLLSVDYEMTDYGSARFRNADGYDIDFSAVNSDIVACLTKAHSIRAGLEVKPTPRLSVRGGYTLNTTPERAVLENVNLNAFDFARQSFSGGLGYSSSGSFFADFAVRVHLIPYEYIIPYDYYYVGNDGYSYVDNNIITPEVSVKETLIDAMMTIGWRF